MPRKAREIGMAKRTWVICCLSLAAACGTAQDNADANRPDVVDPAATARFDANCQTPGYFRDIYRLLSAQTLVDDETAVNRLRLELASRVADKGALPTLTQVSLDTLEGLLVLSLRSVEATATNPRPSRQIGERLLAKSLGLDPARVAWNQAHPDAEPVELLAAGAQSLAQEALWALTHAAQGAPAICTEPPQAEAATWDPGDAEVVWVDQRCEPDRTEGGYCEPDQWYEGDCWDVWVPENCTGGGWEYTGHYEYQCYSAEECEYVWVEEQTYVGGSCTGGYYREECASGYWEYGLCYDGTFVPGYCIPGHYEYRFPGGTWSFESATEGPAECDLTRPAQRAIALASAHVLKDKGYATLDPLWQAALDRLLDSGRLEISDETSYDALVQILNGVASGESSQPE